MFLQNYEVLILFFEKIELENFFQPKSYIIYMWNFVLIFILVFELECKQFFFFFFIEIDERRGYTKKVHPQRPELAPPSWKEEVEGILWAGKESEVSVDAGLKQLQVISRGVDGARKRVPDSGGHGDKRVGESAGSIFIRFFI